MRNRGIQHLIMIMIYNGKKVGHNGPEETTYTKQGFGQHKEVITVTGWFAGEMGGGVSRQMGRWVSSQWGRQGKTTSQTFS